MEFPQLSSSTAVAGTLVLIFFLYAFFTKWPRVIRNGAHRNRLLPEPRGGWPVIGHLHLLSAKEPPHITFGKMADAYGPIFMLRMGSYRALIVSNWEIAKECFSTKDRIFASRPKLLASKVLGYEYAMMGLSPYGSHWRHVRKLATLELLSNPRLEQLQHVRISEVQTSIKKLYELCMNGKEKVLVEMNTWFGDI